MSVLPACVSLYHVHFGDWGGQKGVLESLELEVQTVIVDTGNKTQVLWKCTVVLTAEPSLQPLMIVPKINMKF